MQTVEIAKKQIPLEKKASESYSFILGERGIAFTTKESCWFVKFLRITTNIKTITLVFCNANAKIFLKYYKFFSVKLFILFFILELFLFIPFNFSAQENYEHFENKSFSLKIGTTFLNGVAFERVYKVGRGRKISELEWDISNLLMINFLSEIKISPNIYIGVDLSKAINSGSGGKMVNTDWLGRDSSDWTDRRDGVNTWTHRTFSDVDIEEAYERTIFISFESPLNNNSNLKFDIGFKEIFFFFFYFAKNYVYSSSNQYGLSGFRDCEGSFNGVTGILYWQKFQIPYLELSYIIPSNNKIITDFSFAYSFMVKASAQDRHLFRNLKFLEEYEKGQYYKFGIGIKYKLGLNTSIDGALHYQLIPELIGNTFVIEENTGSRYLLVDSSSVSNEIFKFKIFVSYIF